MINKFDYLTDLERKEWETVYFSVMALQFDVTQAIDRFKNEAHQIFAEAKDETA
jgi:hypothetical protein